MGEKDPLGKAPKGISSSSSKLSAAPVMPKMRPEKINANHRQKIPDYDSICRMCVARPVSKKEADVTPAAKKAMDAEWAKLEKQNAWELDKVREWRDVVAEAKDTVHVGRVFGILVEKGSELPKGHPLGEFKGRVVFQGNNVKDQRGD